MYRLSRPSRGKAKRYPFEPRRASEHDLYLRTGHTTLEMRGRQLSLAFPPLPEDALEPADSRMRRLVHTLPPELFARVLQDSLHIVFEPRKIHLGVDHLNLHLFKSLDREMYKK